MNPWKISLIGYMTALLLFVLSVTAAYAGEPLLDWIQRYAFTCQQAINDYGIEEAKHIGDCLALSESPETVRRAITGVPDYRWIDTLIQHLLDRRQ